MSNITNSALTPNFFATMSAPQINVTGDGTIVTAICDTVSGNGYNISNGIFTASMSGIYPFIINYDLTGLTTSHTLGIATLVTTSGSFIFKQLNIGAAKTSNNTYMIQGIVPVNMSKTDTAYVTIQVSNGAKVVSIGTISTFTGSRIY